MRRTYLSSLSLLLALLLAVVLVVGCGGNEAASSEEGSPAPEVELTAQEIVDQSEQAMQEVTSASFTADVALKVEGDPAKMTDPTAKQLLDSPITFHAEGRSGDKPVAAEMDMTVAFMGQNLAMSMVAKGSKAWLQYEGAWYAVPEENTKGLTEEETSALPTEQLEDLGLDPTAWDVEWELVGTETVDGAEVYHVAAKPDAKKMAADLMKALQDPKLYEKLGDPATAEQLKAQTAQSEQQLKELEKAMDSVAVDLWIETESMYMRKGAIAVGLDMTGVEDAQGVTAMSAEIGFTMADFNEPIEVEPPAKAKDFEKFMNELLGGMMGMGGGEMTF